MTHISVIDWAFKVFLHNQENQQNWGCRIGRVFIGDKTINPNIFKAKPKVGKREEIWQ